MGGAIVVSGEYTITNSLIYSNTATTQGGGIWNEDVVWMINNTVSGNEAPTGGGIYNTQEMALVHNTIVENQASSGGGVYSNFELDLSSNIIGLNSGGADCSLSGTVNDNGYNLDSDSSCGWTDITSLSGQAPQFDALADNGGDTWTHALQSNSPALDQIPYGTNGCGTTYTTDQRGEIRPDVMNTCDMGAFELAQYDCATEPWIVDEEADLNNAISCYNSQTIAGSYTISLTQNISLTASSTTISNSVNGVTLLLEGNDFTVDGQDIAEVRPFYIAISSTVTIQDMTITDGNVTDDGGGIYNSGTLTVDNSALSNNSAHEGGGGGGIYNNGTLTVSNSTVSGNYGNDGGGIYNYSGTATVSNSTLSDNVTPLGGGGIKNSGTATVNNSTLSNNSALGGGGVANHGTLAISNSTLSNNSTHEGGGGGGIFNSGPLTVSNSTLSGNSAPSGNGGGIRSYNGTFDISNSIISDSPSGGDCYNDGGTINDNGFNIVEDNSCGFTGGGDPMLGPLQDNGGDTFTHALTSDSPALDQIPSGTNGCEVTYTADQRGEPRTDWACDMGAFEMQFTDGDVVSKTVATGETHTFGPTLVRAEIVDDGNCLTALMIQRIENDHSNATAGIATGRYWDITPTGCTSGFTVTVTLPYTATASVNDKACRYTGSGVEWDCGDSENSPLTSGPTVMPNIVVRSGVTEFSDWAVGASVGPTAVSLQSFSSTTSNNWWLIVLFIVMGGLTAVFYIPRRVRRTSQMRRT